MSRVRQSGAFLLEEVNKNCVLGEEPWKCFGIRGFKGHDTLVRIENDVDWMTEDRWLSLRDLIDKAFSVAKDMDEPRQWGEAKGRERIANARQAVVKAALDVLACEEFEPGPPYPEGTPMAHLIEAAKALKEST